MTLREQLAEKKQALRDMEPALKAENVTDETIAQSEQLVKEVDELSEKVAKAEKAANILGTLGTPEDTNNDTTEEKSMTELEQFTKSAKAITDKRKGASMHFEKAYNTVITSVQVADVDRSIAPQPRRNAAADLFQNATISGNAVTYFLQGAFETNGGISATSEGSKKPQASTSFTGTTLSLSKLAAFVKETDEILYDEPFLASEVQNTLVYQLGKVEDAHIVNTVEATSGIGAATYDGSTVTFADGILAAIKKVKGDSAYDASVVILNPADVLTLLTSKDSNNQYYGGGYFVGAYGNGGVSMPSAIWGVQIYESSEITQGQALVCAREAVKVWKKGGMDVRIYEQNEDDALYNRVTLLAEERLACAVVNKKGVVLLASSAS